MIREKAIFIKLNLIHLSDQELFDRAIASFRPGSCQCPVCGAVGRFSKIRPYQRELISISSGKRIEVSVSVPRFLCGSCGHSHAVLPDILVPFGSYSLRFILTILHGYLERSCTVADFCAHWEIAVSTLYGWIHLFLEHYNAWCRILDRILWVCHDALAVVSGTGSFPSAFFRLFRFSFLQGLKASPSGCPPPQDRRCRPPLT